mmetsp:Transcript_21426/g.24270  ORF Transcript_21426/g.24270 Transcript_21426/m.24270 type:complete len:89 (+) Transcript_21426:1090-1356(+)
MLILVFYTCTGGRQNPVDYSVSEMRDNLNSFSQKGPLPFLMDDVFENFACSQIMATSRSDVQKSFIVSEIEIAFTSVLENEDFTVFEG